MKRELGGIETGRKEGTGTGANRCFWAVTRGGGGAKVCLKGECPPAKLRQWREKKRYLGPSGPRFHLKEMDFTPDNGI